MGDFPISTFLFWKIKEENKSEWVAYEFIRDYDSDAPHNREASVKGINQDIFSSSTGSSGSPHCSSA